MSSNVKRHGAKWISIYDFIWVFNSNYGPIFHHKGVIGHQSSCDLDFTFQCRQMSNVMVPNESPYMTLYECLIVTTGLSFTIRELLAIKVPVTLIWPFKVKRNGAKWISIYDFIWVFNSDYGPILHHKGVIGHQSSCDLDLTLIWPFNVVQCQTSWCQMNLHIWLHMSV